MPIYKGSNEVTSGNLYKGSTEVQDGYKATDPFYVNETTLTILFVDNTATGSSLNSTSSAVFTGVPGSAFVDFDRFVNRTNATYKVTGASVSEAGDSGNNVNTSVSGSGNIQRTISISGTIPTTSKTITLTVDSTVGNLIARTGSISYTLVNNNTSIVTAQPVVLSWTGPGTGTLEIYANSNGLGGAGFQAGLTVNNSSTTVPSSAPHTAVSNSRGGVINGSSSPPNGGGVNSGTGGSITSVTLGMSVGESSTYQAFSTSTVIF